MLRSCFAIALAAAGVALDDLNPLPEPARSEAEAAAAVASGRAVAAPGLAAMAAEYNLGFLPLMVERFDLAVDRRFWFEPPWQRLLGFTREERFLAHARALDGYDISGLGEVRWNGL